MTNPVAPNTPLTSTDGFSEQAKPLSQNGAGPLLVSAGVIFDGDQFLIAQRRLTDKVEPGRWEFPGGKIEFGESPEGALIREIREELNLEVEVRELLAVSSHVYTLQDRSLHIVLLCYLCDFKCGVMKPLAVADAKWVSVEQLHRYTFAAADVALVEALTLKLS